MRINLRVIAIERPQLSAAPRQVSATQENDMDNKPGKNRAGPSASVPKPLAAFAIAALLCAAAPASAAFKCWTNNEGVRECGNAVPPEFAQKGHETLNKQGRTTNTQDAAKTLEVLEAEREQRVLDRQAELAAAARAQHDRVLLDTFATEDDMVLTRDGQIAHLESQIRLTQGHIDKLQNNVDQMIETAADIERRGENPGEEIVQNIENVRGQIKENETFITTKRSEQEAIRARFDEDIARFRVLKGSQ